MDQPPNNEPSKETDMSIDDYEVDSVPSRKRKASGSPETETQDSEITDNDKMQTSTSAAKGESSNQVAPIEAVKYDYIFKKLLTGTDVNEMIVPLKEAEKHFPRVAKPDVSNSTVVRVYDINREQKREWELSRNYREYSFTGNWKVYVEDNQLQAGDSVLFYIMGRDQIISSELPRYAVKFEKAGEITDMSALHIPFDKLAQEGVIAMMDLTD